MVMMTLFWGGILLLFFDALRSTVTRGDQTSASGTRQPDHALSILQERYARGEIDRDEFEERRRTLSEPLQST